MLKVYDFLRGKHGDLITGAQPTGITGDGRVDLFVVFFSGKLLSIDDFTIDVATFGYRLIRVDYDRGFASYVIVESE